MTKMTAPLFYLLFLASVFCTTTIKQFLGDETDFNQTLPSLLYQNFDSNVLYAEYMYLTWLTDLNQYKGLLKVAQAQSFVNSMGIFYTLAGIEDKEFQEANKNVFGSYVGSVWNRFHPLFLSYEGKFLKLSQFKPRKAFDAQTFENVLHYIAPDPEAFRVWWAPSKNRIFQFVRFIREKFRKDRHDEYYKVIEETCNIRASSLTEVCSFIERETTVSADRPINVSVYDNLIHPDIPVAKLNLILLRWFDTADEIKHGAWELPKIIDDPLIIKDPIYWGFLNARRKNQYVFEVLLELGQKTNTIYRSIVRNTQIPFKIIKMVSSHREILLTMLVKSISVRNYKLSKLILPRVQFAQKDIAKQSICPSEIKEIDLINWWVFVSNYEMTIQNASKIEEIPFGMHGITGFLEDASMESSKEMSNFDKIARLMLVPSDILSRIYDLTKDDFLFWILGEFKPEKAQNETLLFMNSLTLEDDIRLANSVKTVLYELFQTAGNEDLISRYLERIKYMENIPQLVPMFHYNTFINGKPRRYHFNVIQSKPGEYIVPLLKEIKGYWILVDKSKQMKFQLINPGSKVSCETNTQGKFHIKLEGMEAISDLGYFESLLDTFTVLKPLISHNIIDPVDFDFSAMLSAFPDNQKAVLDFKSFCSICSKASNDLLHHDIKELPSLLVDSLNSLYSEMLRMTSNPNFTWEGRPAEIGQSGDIVMVLTSGKNDMIQAPCTLEIGTSGYELTSYGNLSNQRKVQNILATNVKNLFQLVGFLLQNEIVKELPSLKFFMLNHDLPNPDESDISLDAFIKRYKFVEYMNPKSLGPNELILFASVDDCKILNSVQGNGVALKRIDEAVSARDWSSALNSIAFALKLVRRTEIKFGTLPLLRRKMLKSLDEIVIQFASGTTVEKTRLIFLLFAQFKDSPMYEVLSGLSIFPQIQVLADEFVENSKDTAIMSFSLKQSKLANKFGDVLGTLEVNMDLAKTFTRNALLFSLLLNAITSTKDLSFLIGYAFKTPGKYDLWLAARLWFPEISPEYQVLQRISQDEALKESLSFITRHYETNDLLRLLLVDGATEHLKPSSPHYDICQSLDSKLFLRQIDAAVSCQDSHLTFYLFARMIKKIKSVEGKVGQLLDRRVKLMGELERIVVEYSEKMSTKQICLVVLFFAQFESSPICKDLSKLPVFPQIESISDELVERSGNVHSLNRKLIHSELVEKFLTLLASLTIDSSNFAVFSGHDILFRLLTKSMRTSKDIENLVGLTFLLSKRQDQWLIVADLFPDVSPSYPMLQRINATENLGDSLKFITRHYKTPDLLRFLLNDDGKKYLNTECPLYSVCQMLNSNEIPMESHLIDFPSIISVIVDWLSTPSLEEMSRDLLQQIVDHCFASNKLMHLWRKIQSIMPDVAPSKDAIRSLVRDGKSACLEAVGKYYPDAELPDWDFFEELLQYGALRAEILRALEIFRKFSQLISAHRDHILALYPNYCTDHKDDPNTIRVLHRLAESHSIYPPSAVISAIAMNKRYDLMMLLMSLGVNWSKFPFNGMLWNRAIDRQDVVGSSMYLLMRDGISGISIAFENEAGVDVGGPSAEWATLVIAELLKDQALLPRHAPLDSEEDFVFPTLNRDDPICVAKLRLLALVHSVCLRRNVAVDGLMAPILYDKLLEPFPTFSFQDLQFVDCQIAHALASLREFSAEELADEGLTLKSGSALIIADLELFIRQEVEEFFEGFRIFAYEFQRVCDSVYQPSKGKKLMERLHGSGIVTPDAIITATYHYSLADSVWDQFEEALNSLSPEELPLLLIFWTGSARLCIGTSLTVKYSHTVEANGIPEASTCSRELKLSARYDSVEKMVEMIRLAIHYRASFGFH